MRKIGYVRVSSVDQNPKRQLQQMEEIGVDIIYQEKVSGACFVQAAIPEKCRKNSRGAQLLF
ncbi:hypothetical protein BK750_17645 [Bacillus thuringiensis serovar jegathesan]|uniref:Resolvase/invertase-type recombinase catalytic domain-containing protein n=1 Tax=Bacillus thuringiensis subsp. jegathesan TaxID=56955 RepID=A0A9X6QXY8_BACTJ|nr:hypothetical protein BK750_17645 [Bacillus thuringiensis serovar jegathesan]